MDDSAQDEGGTVVWGYLGHQRLTEMRGMTLFCAL